MGSLEDILKAEHYEYLDKLVFEKDYEELLKYLAPFIETHIVYIITRLKDKSNIANKLDNFLKICGKDSYYCIRNFYCEIPREEMKSDIICSIITLASRYEYKEKHFMAYLCNAFYYEYGRTIFYSLKEMNAHDGFKAYFDNIDSNLYDEKDCVDYKLEIRLGYESEFGYLTDKWINEVFQKEDSLFYDLKIKEKTVLMLYYQEKLSDGEISKILNCHLNTVNTLRRNIVYKIGQKYELKVVRTRRKKRGVA